MRELLTPSTVATTRNALDAMLPSLIESLATQFLDTDAVARAIAIANDPATVFHTSRTRRDAIAGPSFELITNTPLFGDFQPLAQSLWDHIVTTKALLEALPLPSAHVKRVEMALPSASSEETMLYGVMTIRKLEQRGRVVFVIATAYASPGYAVVFRETAWVIVSDTTPVSDHATPLSPPATTRFQTFYTVRCEQQDATSATGSAPYTHAPDIRVQSFQNCVVQALGDCMCEHKLEMQSSLLASSTPFGKSTLQIASCPLIESPS